MITCTFAGHREVLHTGVREKLYSGLLELLALDSQLCFYVGGMGKFDAMAEQAVRRLKREFPEKEIRLVLVLPYMKKSVNDHPEVYGVLYDEVIVPEVSACEHFKRAITVRNRWMAEQSQILIAYVHRNFGGAFEMVEYARRIGVDVWRAWFTSA